MNSVKNQIFESLEQNTRNEILNLRGHLSGYRKPQDKLKYLFAESFLQDT